MSTVRGSALSFSDIDFSIYPSLQAIATPLVPNMEKVQIIPPPKDVDPRVVAWKGAAVLGKMDGVADLWITAADWVSALGFFRGANSPGSPDPR